MRKVSETVVKAFLNGKAKSVSNTSCTEDRLYLYGNIIAARGGNGEIRIYNGGYFTATTKERLNALLQLMNSSGKYEMTASSIYQKNFQWYIQWNNGDSSEFFNGTLVGVMK